MISISLYKRLLLHYSFIYPFFTFQPRFKASDFLPSRKHISSINQDVLDPSRNRFVNK